MLMRRTGSTARDLMNLMNAEPFGFASETRMAVLPIDVLEKDGDIVVHASVPGFDKDDVSVTIDKRVLTIRAEHETSSSSDEDAMNEDEPRYYFRERHHSSLERSVRLPADVDTTAAVAQMDNGVLTLTIPRTEAAKPQDIKIN